MEVELIYNIQCYFRQKIEAMLQNLLDWPPCKGLE